MVFAVSVCLFRSDAGVVVRFPGAVLACWALRGLVARHILVKISKNARRERETYDYRGIVVCRNCGIQAIQTARGDENSSVGHGLS